MNDAGLEQFAISKFNKHAIGDFKSISVQIYEFQDLLRKVKLTSCKFSESYKIKAFVDSIPP